MKTTSQMISESHSNTLIDNLITRLEPTIEQMLQSMEKKLEERGDRPFTEYDRTWYKLMLRKDIVKSFAKYTSPTDELVDFIVKGSVSGQLTISASIKREDTTYGFSTDVIYAGGYNIQQLHYRYLTSTNLPQIGDKDIIKKYEDKMKSLSKAEKIQKEIETYVKYVEVAKDNILRRNAMTDDEILRTSGSYRFMYTKWSEINRDSHAWQEYCNDEKGWEEKQEKERCEYIARFIHSTNVIQTRDIAGWEKQIAKLTKKLQEYIE